LARFKNLRVPEDFVVAAIIDVIHDVLDFEIDPQNISYRGGIAYIKVKQSLAKNEIFMKKGLIIEKLTQKLGSNAPKDIRF
jgi:hypothetical protein